MNIPENILVLVKYAYESNQLSAKEALTYVFSMLNGINLYSPPEDGGPDPLEALNQEVIQRFNPPETIDNLLTDLQGANPTRAHCQQAVEVIRQLLGDRPANQMPLMVEDR